MTVHAVPSGGPARCCSSRRRSRSSSGRYDPYTAEPWCNPHLQFYRGRPRWRWSVHKYALSEQTVRSAWHAGHASALCRWLCPAADCPGFHSHRRRLGIPSRYPHRQRISRFAGTLSQKRQSARGLPRHPYGRTDQTASSHRWMAILSGLDALFSAPSAGQSYLCTGRPSQTHLTVVFAALPTGRG